MAQLDNAADSDSEERGFKSLRAGQKKKPVIPYVLRDCRLFSTDEGVNDFLNWLKEDSGYSKAEKKSVLQRIIEFFDRIVEAVKQTIKDGDLSKTAREFAQMQADKAAQIREMFLDALDGIDGKARKNTAEETKNSLRLSLGISDSTAEVASYYGFAAVFAALVASEAADVVDSALAAVVEFVAAALDVAVDSSAEKVPAVEDNSAKADEVSPEFSAGNVVESVDELFCVPFNLKAFRKPFTPRPK